VGLLELVEEGLDEGAVVPNAAGGGDDGQAAFVADVLDFPRHVGVEGHDFLLGVTIPEDGDQDVGADSLE